MPTSQSHRAITPEGWHLGPASRSPTLSPSKAPEELCRIARRFQEKSAELETEVRHLKHRHLADVTNDEEQDDASGSDNEPSSKKARKSDEEATTIQEAKGHAHKFVILYNMWLLKREETFQEELDDEYDPAERFANERNCVQGQLRDLIDCIPPNFHSEMDNLCYAKTFVQEMGQQLWNTVGRLRQAATVAVFSDYAKSMGSSEDRVNLCDVIGYKEDTKTWSVFDVEVLYGEYTAGEVDVNEIFRGPILKKVFCALIRGPRGPIGLLEGKSVKPSTPIMETIHNIHHTTPGAIAASAVLARWSMSPDVQLKSPGDRTGINYQADFDECLSLILRGMARNKRWVKRLFADWDSVLFPLHPSKYGGKIVTNELQQIRNEEIDTMHDLDDLATSESEEEPEEEPEPEGEKEPGEESEEEQSAHGEDA
ncbi:hypothetical protein C8J56DRAFT_901783 [Mycena floridula]|nr:hypothetical protein C8J56DRAFT_901783 [Mycena floridula]